MSYAASLSPAELDAAFAAIPVVHVEEVVEEVEPISDADFAEFQAEAAAGTPRGEFTSEAEAWAWFEAFLADEDFKDNFRLGFADDRLSAARFEQASREGCCGSCESLISINGRRAFIGMNFGH